MKLCDAIRLLEEAGVENPSYDARELFVKIGGMSRAELVSRDAECTSPGLLLAVERRRRREPLQYVIGEVDFYRESYSVDKGCLIPRQDTEILVDYAVKHIPSKKTFIDICTGSGCVAISTLKNTQGTQAVAVDISEDALSIAARNAEKNAVSDRISFILSDALREAVDGDFFAVLSNPPYVTEKAYEGLMPELYFEPRIALVGGADGLNFYRKILTLYKNKINPDGFFAFEIGYDQGNALRDIARAQAMTCEIIKDLSDNDRVAVLKLR